MEGIVGLTSPARRAAWDRSMLLPSPSTPSIRFARDVAAEIKAQAWVEQVIGERLSDGGFGEALKDGKGLCRLINVFRPGTIARIEKSSSPFKQMANISAFLQACRALGVREHALFETLDLYNEKRLPQVARCLFSLSEVVRTTMSDSFLGPFLSAPEKPEVDPTVKAIVDLSKGNILAPGWGPTATTEVAETGGCAAGDGGGSASRGARHGSGSPFTPKALYLSLPTHVQGQAGGGCLSPAAHASGQLTYGIYEGGGRVRSPSATQSSSGSGCVRSASCEQGTVEALAAQRQVDVACKDPKVGTVAPAAGSGGPFDIAGSTMPVVNTPRVFPVSSTPLTPKSVSSRSYMSQASRACSSVTTPGGPVGRERLSREEEARRKREVTARLDAELEAALWIEGVTGVTFPGRFWSSLKDGVLLCKLINAIQPGLIPRVNTAKAPFPEMENIAAFLSACRTLGVAEHSLFETKDLHNKRDLLVVVRCIHILGATIQATVPDFKGPFLGKKSETFAGANARGLRKQLGKGPGAKGGIRTLVELKGGCRHEFAPDVLVENPDPTATVTPAESPLTKKTPAPVKSDSAAGSNPKASPSRRRPGDTAINEGGAVLRPVDSKEDAVVEDRGRGKAKCGRHLVSSLTAEVAAMTGGGAEIKPQRSARSVHETVGGHRRKLRREEAKGEDVVSQVQAFIELHTTMPWRIKGDLYESLRDGWQLALLVNALKPGAIRRVHNSIQPAKHVQNIANFLIACRRLGVARALLFDIDDLYANRSQTKVVRTLLALRALAADPDFARVRRSSSLLVCAAAAAAATASKDGTPSCPPAAGLWS